MTATITLANLSWRTPDGTPLFSNLDLTFGPERAGLVGRNGVGKTTLLRLIAGEAEPASGFVTSNATLGVLRQAVQVASGDTVSDLFGTRSALALIDRVVAGKASPAEVADADWTLEARMAAALDSVGLSAEATTPLAELSGGQRTRAALAGLVFADPDFLLLDEPTNNLDRAGRTDVARLLAGWKKGAIIVSHDRQLLDIMDAIVEMTTLGVTRYGGNWSQYRQRKALELTAAQHDLAHAERVIAEKAQAAQEALERKARKDSGGRRKAARGDMPRIVIGGLKRQAENTSGALSRLASRQRDDAEALAADAREKIEVLQPMTVAIPSSGLPSGRVVLRLDGITAGYVEGKPILQNVSMSVTGPERVAIVGRNGSGKTTVLNVIAGGLQPWSGHVHVPASMAFLDQRVSLLDPASTIRDNFRRLNPDADENTARAALARFMFRADAALQTVSTLSGGQMLRAALACVLGNKPPDLLILDEPTNHLDIDSIEAVEAGLRAFDGALLVVSHDETFLENIGVTRRIDLAT